MLQFLFRPAVAFDIFHSVLHLCYHILRLPYCCSVFPYLKVDFQQRQEFAVLLYHVEHSVPRYISRCSSNVADPDPIPAFQLCEIEAPLAQIPHVPRPVQRSFQARFEAIDRLQLGFYVVVPYLFGGFLLLVTCYFQPSCDEFPQFLVCPVQSQYVWPDVPAEVLVLPFQCSQHVVPDENYGPDMFQPGLTFDYRLAGWPRAVAHPRLPRIRTCPIKAYGSSDNGFAAQRYTLCTTRAGGRG